MKKYIPTPFGKELRKLRVNLDINLKQMSNDLKFSSTFLSNIELGKKSPPKDLINKLYLLYGDVVDVKLLQKLATDINKEIRIKLTENKNLNELLFEFKRAFDSLNEEQINLIMEILNEK